MEFLLDPGIWVGLLTLIVLEIVRLKEAFRSAKGIVDHEFSQEVIDACREADEARQQRILNGETTFEEEDAALMAEWRRLNPK